MMPTGIGSHRYILKTPATAIITLVRMKKSEAVIKRRHCPLQYARAARDLVQQIDDDLDALFVERYLVFVLGVDDFA